MLNIAHELYSLAAVSIKASDKNIELVAVTRGVLQGEVLSHLLFALILADIVDFFAARDFEGVSITQTMTFAFSYMQIWLSFQIPHTI